MGARCAVAAVAALAVAGVGWIASRPRECPAARRASGGAADPSEIGPVIAFVGSKVNTSMTGADVNVDGGSDFT